MEDHADRCPVCGEEFTWDGNLEQYAGVIIHDGNVGNKNITLALCPNDQAVVAVIVSDRYGVVLHIKSPHAY